MFDQMRGEGDKKTTSDVPAWMRLHAEMQSATRRRCAWDAEHMRHLREAEALQLWNHFGYISLFEYLERQHGIEPKAAKDRLRVSLALAELPLLEAELEDGTFAYSHVKELTRVATPETEEEWIAAAKGKTCGDVERMVAGHKKGDGPEDPTDPDLRVRWLSLGFTPQMLAMYRELQAAIAEEMGHAVEETEVLRIILERAKGGGEGASTPAQISVCNHCERGWQSGSAELDPAELATALCDADHLGALNGGGPERKRSTVSPRMRQQIIARHGHRCAVPGCRSKRHLDVHHIDHQADGGEHVASNLVALCAGHHRMHHRGLLAIEGRAPDQIRFAFIQSDVQPQVGPKETHVREQARDALVGLGWKSGIATSAVDEAIACIGSAVAIDALIREALRRCPRPLG